MNGDARGRNVLLRALSRDKTFYENKCATLDRQIDNLVYELYELTPEEMAIVALAIARRRCLKPLVRQGQTDL